MPNPQYIVLLRGINVGGKNIVPMSRLRDSLASAGFSNVHTYIQSGNVLLRSSLNNTEEQLATKVKKILKDEFDCTQPCIVYTQANYQTILDEAPSKFGEEPERYRYDVIFLDNTINPNEALRQLSLKDGVDWASAGSNALYFRRLTAKASSSKLSKIVLLPFYKDVTIRNWNTTKKLADLLVADSLN